MERTDVDADALRWYEAFANWRNAVAVQQLCDRHDDRLAASERTVALLVEGASALLEERRG